MTDAALKMSGIGKSFPGVRALDEVDLQACAGEVLGLVGVNGAGKSTLMNILGGVLQPNQGEISIDGRVVSLLSPIDASRSGIAFIHQELLNFASQTVAENIFMARLPVIPLLPFFTSKQAARTQARRLLDVLGSNISVTDCMEVLSVGEKQIVEIARALATGANIVIFDEPTSSLSFKEKRILFDIVQRLKSEGKTIIYISHFLDEIESLCDKYLVLRNGKVAGQGAVAEISRQAIVRMIVGEEVAERKSVSKANNNETYLRVRDFSNGTLMKGISFDVKQGEILGIWGLMGSGRTELLRAMTGLDSLRQGELSVLDKGEFSGVTPDQLLRRCGYLTENRRVDGLFLDESVWKNISVTMLGKYASRVCRFLNSRQEIDTGKKLVDSLAIKTPTVNTRLANLSGGNQQKVILAKWLNKRPKVLLLDEPTRGVDVGAKIEIGQLITELSREGTATVLITSELEEMVALADRVLVLRTGEIVGELVGEYVKEQTMMSLALGEDEIGA